MDKDGKVIFGARPCGKVNFACYHDTFLIDTHTILASISMFTDNVNI